MKGRRDSMMPYTAGLLFLVVALLSQVEKSDGQERLVRLITFGGSSFVRFNFDVLPQDFWQPTDREEFSFYFTTRQPNGLLWLQDTDRRTMYLGLRNSQLIFSNKYGNEAAQEIIVGGREGARFDNDAWYKVKVVREGRRVTISVNDRYRENYNFRRSDGIQFLSPVEIHMGGAVNPYEVTGGRVDRNFRGTIGMVVYKSTPGPGLYYNVDISSKLGDDGDPGISFTEVPWPGTGITLPTVPRTTRPTPPPTTPTPPLTAITIKDKSLYFSLLERFRMESGSTISFKFSTIKRNALLLYTTSNILGRNYMALEIYDGKLYFIHNFGGSSKRTLISEIEVSDGQPHEVELRFFENQIVPTLDGQTRRIALESNERLPQNLGRIIIGGTSSYSVLPWHTWARESYQGCLEDLKINGRIVDFRRYISAGQLYGRVEQYCIAMPKQCSLLTPCAHGFCTNGWESYTCDCRATDYTGKTCNMVAWTGLFNGSEHFLYTFVPEEKYHVDDISFRFKTMVSDGFIFQTKGVSDDGFMRMELEGGRIKITTNLGGQYQSFYVGENLNDMRWHTVYLQRRGNHMEVWVDDMDHEKVKLPGADYFHYLRHLYIGGYDKNNLNVPDSSKFYIGYLRNFFIGGRDIFQDIHDQNSGIVWRENIPPLIFNDITIPHYDAHIKLPALGSGSNLNINFLFRTNDPNGVILFSEGKNKELFAVELFGGRLHVRINEPTRPGLHLITPENLNFADGTWHSVMLNFRNVDGQEQLTMGVDSLHSQSTYPRLGNLNLQGPLYIGGLSPEMFKQEYIQQFLSSKTGFRGCLASLDFGGTLYDLFSYGQTQGVKVINHCTDIISSCTPETCFHGGICHDHVNNGSTWCDCSATGFAGPRCRDEPLGYTFRSDGIYDRYGMMVYTYPPMMTEDSANDTIVLGVMTKETDAVLVKLISAIFGDFITIKLVKGFPVVVYDTDGEGASTTITSDINVSDGKYHIIKFIRTKDRGTLIVDEGINFNTHQRSHGDFDRLSKIFIGGVYQSKKIVGGTGYHGIIGGLYVNGKLIFPDAVKNVNIDFYEDVKVAPIPYTLGPIKPTPAPPTWKTTTTQRPMTPTPIPPFEIPILPGNIGGGGIAWTFGGGGGTGTGTGGGDGEGVNVVVFPDGSEGSAGAVPGILPPAGGAGTPVAVAHVATIPSLPATGPRAGAVMGTILGLAALASSLMWAFYRCKPGWCGGGGGGGGGAGSGAMSISSPRAGSNIGAVTAAGGAGAGGAGAGGAGAGGAGAGLDVVDAPGVKISVNGAQAGAGGAGGVNTSSYYLSTQSAAGGGHQRTESYDSATLRATGTFSNKGTAIGTPRSGRHQFASASSAYTETNMVTTPASLQSYHFEGGHSMADYDVASGVHSNYQSNTLNVPSGGVGAGGGGYSTSTMSSNYNYSVKTIRTVGGQQQMLGYAGGSQSNVIVTPGAMGEEVRVDCCLMTSDGQSVVTGSSLGPPQVWNMSNGELLRIMQGETVGSTYLHLVCNDRLLVGAINADLEINQYSVPKGVHNYVFQIWDLASGRPLAMADPETLSALTVMSDNDKVVFGRSDKFGGGTNIVVWDLLGNQPMKEMRYDAPVGNNDYISYINLSQNDRYVVAGFTNTFDNFAEFVIFDMTLTSYNVSDPNILRLDAAPECTAILPREEAVTGLRNGDLVVWSLRTGQPSRQLLSNAGKHAHSREVKAVARSQDNRYLVSASADGTLKLWDMESERHICTMSGHNDEVWCAAISSDNEIVVSGSRDGTIRLWQLRSGKEICAFNAGVDVFYITMSNDKSTIVALGDKFGARKLIMLQVVRSKVKRQVLA